MYLPVISPTEQVFIKQWLKDSSKWNYVPKIIAYKTYQQDSPNPIERFAFTNFLNLLSIGTSNFRYNGKQTPTYRQRTIMHLTSQQIINLCTPPQPATTQSKPFGRPKSIKPFIPSSDIKLTEL